MVQAQTPQNFPHIVPVQLSLTSQNRNFFAQPLKPQNHRSGATRRETANTLAVRHRDRPPDQRLEDERHRPSQLLGRLGGRVRQAPKADLSPAKLRLSSKSSSRRAGRMAAAAWDRRRSSSRRASAGAGARRPDGAEGGEGEEGTRGPEGAARPGDEGGGIDDGKGKGAASARSRLPGGDDGLQELGWGAASLLGEAPRVEAAGERVRLPGGGPRRARRAPRGGRCSARRLQRRAAKIRGRRRCVARPPGQTGLQPAEKLSIRDVPVGR